MKFIKVINGKPYKVKGSPSHHHQSGWYFPNSSLIKDSEGFVIKDFSTKKNILTQISNIEIQKKYKK
jgi:hypothetical protein